MATNEIVYGLILAGGKSSRMGQDKALMPFAGVPMVKRVGLVGQECTDGVFMLSPWQERYAGIRGINWQFIVESEPGQGALGGLRQGLVYFSRLELLPQWVLLLACDLPCLESRVVQKWRSQLVHLHRSCLALVPKDENRWEPLCAFYRMECLAVLQQSQTRSFQRWLGTIPTTAIVLDGATQGMLKNCNTPQDLVI